MYGYPPLSLLNFLQSCFTQDCKILVAIKNDEKFFSWDEPYLRFVFIPIIWHTNERSFILVCANGFPPINTFMGPLMGCHLPTILFISTMMSLLSLLLLVKVTLSNSFMMSFLGMTGYSPWKFLSPPFAYLNKKKFLLLLLLPSWEFMQLRYHIFRVL